MSAITKQQESYNTVSGLVNKMKSEIEKVIPQHITVDRLARTFMTACQKNPKLLSCSSKSLLKAYMDAGEIGLEPDGINAHLIPYGNEATFMVDYKGYIRLARLSEEVADMTANVVYSNDEFSHEYGSNKHLKHIKTLLKERGDRIAAYSYVKYKDGSEDFRVLTADEVMHAKKSSKSDKIWDNDPDPMWAKTAVRQHAKFLPRQKALQNAAIKEEKIDMGFANIDLSQGQIEEKTQKKTDKLKENLKKENKQAENGEWTDLIDGYINANGLERVNEALKTIGLDTELTYKITEEDRKNQVIDCLVASFENK